MSLSFKESEKIRKLICSVKKRTISEQNSEPHSAVSTRIVESSNPSWSPILGPVDGSDPTSESSSIKRRKDKSRKLEDVIQRLLTDYLIKRI